MFSIPRFALKVNEEALQQKIFFFYEQSFMEIIGLKGRYTLKDSSDKWIYNQN